MLATAQGIPLAGAAVTIAAVPDNGSGEFATIAHVHTSARGRWTATLPPGPSRISDAVWAGSATVLPASGTATTIVPARIRIRSITPQHTTWGSTITIHGKLFGGDLPAAGAVVVLRYGYGGHQIVYGVKQRVAGDGAFTTRFTFGPRGPHERLSFQLATLAASDYPYASARSNTVSVDIRPARQ